MFIQLYFYIQKYPESINQFNHWAVVKLATRGVCCVSSYHKFTDFQILAISSTQQFCFDSLDGDMVCLEAGALYHCKMPMCLLHNHLI